MTVLLDASSRVLAVNATGAYGAAQLRFMSEFGTRVVAHVAAGRVGSIDGLPVFSTIAEAVAATHADTAAIFTPAAGVRDSVEEAALAGLKLAFATAEFVPLHDVAQAAERARAAGMWLVGPNSSGIASPGKAVLGALAPGITSIGRIGVIGRSGTLTMNVCRALTVAGLGQSTVVHIGGDVICGRNPHEWLRLFLDDPDTDLVVYLGEPGGTKEYTMAAQIEAAAKPVIALVVGRHVPQQKRMGHAGALVGNDRETSTAKIAVLAAAGARIARSVPAVVALARQQQSPRHADLEEAPA